MEELNSWCGSSGIAKGSEESESGRVFDTFTFPGIFNLGRQ